MNEEDGEKSNRVSPRKHWMKKFSLQGINVNESNILITHMYKGYIKIKKEK